MSSVDVEYICKHCGKIAMVKDDDYMHPIAVNHCKKIIHYTDPNKGDVERIAHLKKLSEPLK